MLACGGSGGAAFEGHAHTHTYTNSYIHRDGLVVGAALGRFYCSAFKDELTRARLTFSYTYIYSHTHTPIEAHHAQCKATQACEGQQATGPPTIEDGMPGRLLG